MRAAHSLEEPGVHSQAIKHLTAIEMYSVSRLLRDTADVPTAAAAVTSAPAGSALLWLSRDVACLGVADVAALFLTQASRFRRRTLLAPLPLGSVPPIETDDVPWPDLFYPDELYPA